MVRSFGSALLASLVIGLVNATIGLALKIVTFPLTIVTFGLLAVVIVVSLVLSYPDVALVPTLVAGLAVAVVVPVVGYPFSYTIWAAIDLTMRPLEPAEVADADRHRGQGA